VAEIVLRTARSTGATIRAEGYRMVLDATISEEHEEGADVTENPVESGEAVSDHVQPRAARVVLEGVVSCTPFESQAAVSPEEPDRDFRAWADLRETLLQSERVRLITPLRVYDDMVLAEMSLSRGGEQAIRPTLTFRHVRVVRSAVVEVAPGAVRNRGRQPTLPAGSSDTALANAEVAAESGRR